MTIGAPYDFRKVTTDGHRYFEGEDVKEKHTVEDMTTSRQRLTAKPLSTNNSSQPTPCPSATDLHLSDSAWGDDEGSVLIPNPVERGSEDPLTHAVVNDHLTREV